jgi:hypothetical protein
MSVPDLQVEHACGRVLIWYREAQTASPEANELHMAQPEKPAEPVPARPLTPEARRALQEAEERRRLAEQRQAANPLPKEVGGRKGPDPTRYGDWEKDGIASDF